MTLREANVKYLRISSNDRKADNDTVCDFGFDTTDTDLNHIKRFTVHTISFPNQFNNITIYNQNLQFSVGSFPLIVNTITLPIGQYNLGQLIGALQALIQPFTGGVITITQDPITGALTITSTGDTMKFYSSDTVDTSPLAPVIGISTTGGGFALSVLANNPPALQGEQIVFFHSDNFALGQTRITENIAVSCFASVDVTVPFGSYQNYQPEVTNDVIVFTSSLNFGNARIRVRGTGGRLLSLPTNSVIHIILKVYY